MKYSFISCFILIYYYGTHIEKEKAKYQRLSFPWKKRRHLLVLILADSKSFGNATVLQ